MTRKRLKISSLMVTCLMVASVMFFVHAAAGKKPKSLKQLPADKASKLKLADEEFAKHNYKKAMDMYEEILAGAEGQYLAEPDIRLKIAAGHYQLREYTEAVAAAEQLLKSADSPLMKARAHHLLGNTYYLRRHWGYKIGGKIYFDDEHTNGEYVNTDNEDWDASDKNFALARKFYLEAAAKDSKAQREAITLYFDYAQFLEKFLNNYGAISKLLSSRTTIKPPKELNLSWTVGEKMALIYNEVESLAAKMKKPDLGALARYRKGIFFIAYYDSWYWTRIPNEYQRIFGEGRKAKWYEALDKKRVDGLDVLKSFFKDYPKSALAPEVKYTIAVFLNDRKQDFLAAEKQFEELIAGYKDSKWASDAKYQLQQMRAKRLSVSSEQPYLPDTMVKVDISTRNVKTVTVEAYVLDLEEYLKDVASGKTTENWLSVYQTQIETIKKYAGKQIFQRDEDMKDKADHKWLSKTITVPLGETGAYWIKAVGDDGKVESHQIVLVTDLNILKKVYKDHVLAFVTDAIEGKPVAGAKIILKEEYYSAARQQYDTLLHEGETDAEGVYTFQIDRGKGDKSSLNFQALAVDGKSYAVTDYYSASWRAETDHYKVFAVTDRPVYRPQNQVNYKLTFRARVRGDFEVLAEKKVRVTIRDPQGNEVLKEEKATDRYGSVWGQFTLGEEPPLGLYYVNGELLDSGNISRWSYDSYYFRVEEYKKPEFIMEINPSSRQIKKGDKAKATIHVKYYFGAPVVGGEVEYTVFENEYYHWWSSPGEFDWFYDIESGTNYGRGSESGNVVAQGKGVTDEKGDLEIEFKTSKGKPDLDYQYNINVKVTDQSRRTIEGSGSVKATRTQFFAFVEGERYLFKRGDNVELQIRTLTPDNFPVATEGKIEIVELRWNEITRTYKEYKTIHTGNVSTDENGKGFYTWKSAQNGLFRFRFKTVDAWDQVVKGSTDLWIADESFTGERFAFQDIEIITDKRVYKPGDTAQLLVSSKHKDGYVLMIEEAGWELLGREVLPLNGSAAFYSLKITNAHVPNFFLCAYLMRKGVVYRQEKEMFVAPVQRFMQVSVTPNKDKYRPREKGSFMIKTTDWAGNPVQAQLSMSAVDSSIYYIQTETAQDPRKFFFWERRDSSTWNFEMSFDNRFYGANVDNQEYEKFETHGMPPSWYWAYARAKYFMTDVMTSYGVLNFSAEDVEKLLKEAEESSRSSNMLFGSESDEGGRMYKSMGAEPEAMMTSAVGGAMPPPSPAPMMEAPGKPSEEKAKRNGGAAADDGGEEPLAEATVRENFQDTAFWTPNLETDSKGEARVEFEFPDNLTTWALQSRGITQDTKAGKNTTEVITTKDLIVRLQAPRFFVQRDEILVSAIVHNYLKTDKKVKVVLSLPAQLKLLGEGLERTVTVPKDGEVRLDWMVQVVSVGQAEILVKALTDEESDAMKLSFPVFIHGVEKFQAFNGSLMQENSMSLPITVPEQREKGSGRLVLTLSPSLASAMLDAIPYLIRYPYGCTEQTMSRFLPAVLVRKTLSDLGVDLKDIQNRREKMPNLEHSAEDLFWDDAVNPVYDENVLKDVIQDGIKRLYDFQHGDGGWGWWENDSSDPYMTAYVVMGLQLAVEADQKINAEVIRGGLDYLRQRFLDVDEIHLRLFMANALSLAKDKLKAEDLDPFYVRRDDLNDYDRAMLALAYYRIGGKEKAKILAENMENYVKVDEPNQTAYWPGEEDYWWFWYSDPIETNAMVLNALSDIDPANKLSRYLVKWIVNNRTGKRWKSTKDTAMVVYALCDYIKNNAEFDVDMTVNITYGDKIKKELKITRENIFTFDNKLLLDDTQLVAGETPLRIEKLGKGNLYWSAELVYFTLEEDIKGAGNEIFVDRKYFKLTPKLIKNKYGERVLEYDRKPVSYQDTLQSGDEVEVVLNIEAKNNYEYVIFEDYKPSGFEPIELKSGYTWGQGMGSNMELRDEKVVFFVGWLEQGKSRITYKLRAEIPGRLHVMPTIAYAMYAPKVRAISDEFRVEVKDKEKK